MGAYRNAFGPHAPDATYVEHPFPEQLVDLGEVEMNHVVAGDGPPLLLVPGQTESWWGYEEALPLLAERFRCYAVDLRGQGRSTRTPGRYTLDNLGNDLVRFVQQVIGGPTWVSGLSSGGVLSAWLSAYAPPGLVLGAVWEDPPLFASEVRPAIGPGIRQAIGPMFDHWATYLGDQWSIGDWDGLVASAPDRLPAWMAGAFAGSDGPPQNLKEYDPEWGRAFWSGTVGAGCDHERMLRAVRVPVLLTQHFRHLDDATGLFLGASTDAQSARVRELVPTALDYVSLPEAAHSLHGQDPAKYAGLVTDWITERL